MKFSQQISIVSSSFQVVIDYSFSIMTQHPRELFELEMTFFTSYFAYLFIDES